MPLGQGRLVWQKSSLASKRQVGDGIECLILGRLDAFSVACIISAAEVAGARFNSSLQDQVLLLRSLRYTSSLRQGIFIRSTHSVIRSPLTHCASYILRLPHFLLEPTRALPFVSTVHSSSPISRSLVEKTTCILASPASPCAPRLIDHPPTRLPPTFPHP